MNGLLSSESLRYSFHWFEESLHPSSLGITDSLLLDPLLIYLIVTYLQHSKVGYFTIFWCGGGGELYFTNLGEAAMGGWKPLSTMLLINSRQSLDGANEYTSNIGKRLSSNKYPTYIFPKLHISRFFSSLSFLPQWFLKSSISIKYLKFHLSLLYNNMKYGDSVVWRTL